MADITTGLLAYYKFSEGVGLTAANTGSLGAVVNGTLTGGITWATGKNSPYSVLMNGIDGFVNLSNNNGLNITGTSISLMGWIFPTLVSTSFHRIIERGADYPNLQYSFDLEQTSGKLIFDLDVTGGGVGASAKSNTAITPNVWTHAACTWDGANRVIYINGAVDSVTPTVGTIPSYLANNCYLGKYTGVGNNWFTGRMDEIRIYNRALVLADVRAAMQAGASRLRSQMSLSLGVTCN